MAKKRLAPTITSPAKMGEEMAYPRAVAAESPNVKYRPRGGGKSDAPVGTIHGVRPGHQERLGAKWAPQMVMSSPQAPESGLVGKNVRTLPSAVGNRDFFFKRQYGQRMQ